MYSNIAIAILCVILGEAFAAAKPDREIPKKEQKTPAVPTLPERCQYGDIVQNGKNVTLAGPIWRAEGKFREDGTLFLLWEEINTGRVAPSVYKVDGDKIHGDWGWAERVNIQPDGSITGDVIHDSIIRVSIPIDA